MMKKKPISLKNNTARPFKAGLLISVSFFAIVLLTSCFGVTADISLNANGSGTITLEYRVSQVMDALGRLDGNERWNTIPVGRADFERTVDRLPDMRLLSFSSRTDARDIIVSARMEFTSIQGLLAFLDASGRSSSFTGDAGSGRLVFTLSEGTPDLSAELLELLAVISDGYSVNINMSFPGGRRVSHSFPLYTVLSSDTEMNIEFNW